MARPGADVLTFWDWAALFSVLLLAGALVLITMPKGEGGEVLITLDGEVFGKYPFKNAVIEVVSERGENTVEISPGGARILDASCPDKLCMRTGVIKKAGESIVCLPNRLVISILGKSKVDSTSY